MIKQQNKKIFLSLWRLISLLWQTIPVLAQQQQAQEEIQIPENKIGAAANLKPAERFAELRQTARGAEFPALMQKIFGADALVALTAIDADSAELFKAVGETLDEKSNETLMEETEERKEKLKADLINQVNQNKVKSNVKSPAKPKKPATRASKTVSLTNAPQLDWRQLAFGFQPLQTLSPPPQQNGKPDVKITQTDKEIKAEGEDKKDFDTDKASVKRTRKAESKFIKDGKNFGVEIKHTEIIEAKSKTDGTTFRKENIMFWSALVAACPDVNGITAGTGKGYVNAKTFITSADGATATLMRDVTDTTKTTGYVNDEAEMTHYDLEADALEIIRGYDDAAAKKLLTDVVFKD
ncbi:MAG TPA: hypothetical protein VEQ34_12085, partial [Pyrinomonadaceae bacterium]|nr:hypothetical protein [Pyrinomonadaceae bacterium]